MDLSILSENLSVQSWAAFATGVVSFLSPCVYPLVPVTISILTADCKESKCHQMLRSAAFASGIVVTYTTLGIIAAKAGIMFGGYLGSPVFIFIAATLLTALLLSTIGFYQIPFFCFLQSLGSKVKAQGTIGAFFMGLASGLLAAPCIGPVLASILMVAASHTSESKGSVLLFMYSLGLGLPFFILGTFTGALCRIPKAGLWLYWIKAIMAVGITLTIAYLLSSYINPELTKLNYLNIPLMSLLLAAFGSVLIKFGIYNYNPKLKLVGVLLVSLVAYQYLFFTPVLKSSKSINWYSSLEDASLSKENKLIFVDTYATWCGSCKELESNTFSDSAFQQELTNWRSVQIDFSNSNQSSSKFSEQFNIQGVPTLLFLDSNGKEINGTRVIGFIGPKELASHMTMIRAKYLK